jgi:four helix bundle protein
MKYQRFEEMPVWQEAGRLYQHVLNVVEEPNVPLSPTFRGQLERAALCVSNCVAEAFEGVGTGELRGLLVSARGAAAEVQSMVSVIVDRPKVVRLRDSLQQIRASADSCARQLAGWKYAIDNPGQRRPSQEQHQASTPGAPTASASTSPGSSSPRNRT